MITERLINLRKEKDSRRQADVAKALNISPSTYSTYEQGTREADHAMLLKLAKYYGVSIDYLLGLTDQRQPISSSDLSDQFNAIQSQLDDTKNPVQYLNTTLNTQQRKILIAAINGLALVAASTVEATHKNK